MLRARVPKTHSSSYVCDLCRYKLNQPVVSPQWRSNPTSTYLYQYPSCNRYSTARFYTTTKALRNPKSNNNEGGSAPNRLPGSSFRGAALGGFGGFGVKKANTVTDPSQASADGLLPHERAARQKAAPSPEQAGAKTESQKQHHRTRSPHRERLANARSPEHQEQVEKSRSVLEDIFSRSQHNRRPRPAGKPDSKTDSKTDSKPKDGSDKPAWGAFGAKKATISSNDSPAQHGAKADRGTRWGSFSKQKVNTEADLSSLNAIRAGARSSQNQKRQQPADTAEKMRAGRTSARDRQPAAEESDFWGELESRVSDPDMKSARRASRAARVGEDGLETSPSSYTSPRFGRDAEERGKKRDKFADKRNKKAARAGRWEDEDYDEDARARFEEIQRRKEEKRQRRLQQEEEQANQPTPIFLPEFISAGSLAHAIKQRPESFLYDLEEMGFENMTSDTIMTGETASLIAMEYGFDPTVDDGAQRDIRPRPQPEDPTLLPPRPPIVTIMGHVDHGKTTLLDWLRKSSVAAQEHGGITQHIGAFIVKMSSGKPITFLDTPGHAAFLTMRQRGANVTDIVVLVVAADDSVKPQTLEAIKHANSAKVPIIVAINKIDKPEARIDQVKSDLSRHGVHIEDYGGDVQVVCVSGKTGEGMEDLEENIVTLSEMLDARSEHDGMAEGWVLESSIKSVGKVATVLIKRGTLRTGDVIVAGRSWARVRSLRNEAGVEVDEAPPGTPVEILGWRDLPEAGMQVIQAPEEDKAKTAVEYREEMADRKQSSAYLAEQEERQREKAAAEAAAAALESADSAGATEDSEPSIITQNFVVKADVAGSVEAVVASVLEQGNNEVQSKVLRSGTGQISEYDVDHAATSKSILVNFNTAVQPSIKLRANEAGVRIIDHSVIYHLVDETREALSDLLPKTVSHKVQGEADVLQIFPINLKGRTFKNIAGCRVRNGIIKKTSLVKVLRRGEVIFDGKMETLKHVKKNVMEMGKGSECGIGLDGFQDLAVDDQVQTYEIIEEKRHL